jgi:HNH endonuclease
VDVEEETARLMTWEKSREARQQDARTYGSAEYRRNREITRRRAGGRCEQCGHPHPRLECDHIVNVAGSEPNHDPSNLQMLCKGPGSCQCHEKKTAQEGGGYRSRGPRDPQPRPGTQW